MKFILTIDWTLINVEEIIKIQYKVSEMTEKIYSYFILKNGEKFDVHDACDSFQVDDDINYEFDAWCHKTFNYITLKEILCSRNEIFDINEEENYLWELFIEKCRQNMNKLYEKSRVIGKI